MVESEIIYSESGEYRYCETFNHQVNPNLTVKHNKWADMVNAVGDEKKLTSHSTYTRKKITKTVNGKKKTSYEYVTPEVCTAHDFRLTIPDRAYIKGVTVEIRMRCTKGLEVAPPSAWFMVYGQKGTVTQQTKKGTTGWYNTNYRVYQKGNLSSTMATYSYKFPESEWKKAGYLSNALNKPVMGVDLHFAEPTKMTSDSKNIYINWIRIKVDYELEKPYLTCNSKFVDEDSPVVVDVGDDFKLDFEFGNRACVNAGYKEIPIQLPLGTTLVSENRSGTSSEFYPASETSQGSGDYIWKVNCSCNAKSKLLLDIQADTIGSKITTATLDGIPTSAYAYANGRSEDTGTAYITSGNIQKGQISCFQFVANAYSLDGTITYDVVVDGENQSDPNDLSEVFRETYHNPDGTGNNLARDWIIDDSSIMQGVSIDESLTNNNRITFNIPEDTTVQIAWTGCFIPVTVGDNTLYLTNNDTGNIKSYQYTSYAPKTTILHIQPMETMWYDHWVTARMQTGAFILPFVTKSSDRLMVTDDCNITMTLEKRRAYIGCIPLPRSHYEPSSDFTNNIVKKQYKNKKYLGKTGEIDENIDFKIKLPPKDWTTLQGLCELDKPVPVNAVPTAFEGDVLNHRGWVELGGVKNVKKTNPLYYDGELELEYLTHNINTKFKIVRGARVSKYNTTALGSLLDYVVESGDEFADYYHINEDGSAVYNDTGYFKIDTDGVYIYDDDEDVEDNRRTLITMDNNQKILMKSTNPLKETTRINFEWFSSKITENRENNISRIIRLKDTSDNIVFEYEYYDYYFDYDDELYSCNVKCTKLDKTQNQMQTVIDKDDLNFAVDFEALNLKVDEHGNVVQEAEPTYVEGEEAEPTYIDPVTGETVEIVQDTEVYNDYMYGSTLTLELAGNILSLTDAGFNGREVHEENIELEKGEYYLEVEFMNRNINSDTPDVYHFFDFEIEEPIILTDFDRQYADTIVSSYPLPDKRFTYIRNSEEGMLYYYHYDGKPYTYIQEPFYMYFKGVDLTAGTGQSIFNLNNSYTIFYVQNGLVRIGFNRLTGAIYLAKYDLMKRDYVTVSSFYIKDKSDFRTGAYSDDKIEVMVGNTVFTVYRGYPYVVVKHSGDDLYFTTTWNRVFADAVAGVEEAYPVLWDLMNHENLLPDCVGGLDLKASCLTVSPVDNDNVGAFPTLTLSRASEDTVYVNDDVQFNVSGSVGIVDEEIPLDVSEFSGLFGEYSISLETDKSVIKSVSLSSDRAITPSGEPFAIRAKVTDFDNKGIGNVKVMFYEEE